MIHLCSLDEEEAFDALPRATQLLALRVLSTRLRKPIANAVADRGSWDTFGTIEHTYDCQVLDEELRILCQ